MADLAHKNTPSSSAPQLKDDGKYVGINLWPSCCQPKAYPKPNISVGTFKQIASRKGCAECGPDDSQGIDG